MDTAPQLRFLPTGEVSFEVGVGCSGCGVGCLCKTMEFKAFIGQDHGSERIWFSTCKKSMYRQAETEEIL